MLKLNSELSEMTSREVVATWNVMQFLRRTLNGGVHENEPLVAAELVRRGIPHVAGKRIVTQ